MANVEINQQYYSGAQVSIFIGDTWIDDVVSIAYQQSHSRQPIFGYGSQHWDFVPKGIIMYQGEFTINFREPNYLWMVLERYKKFNSASPVLNSRDEQARQDKITERIHKDNETFPGDSRRNLENFFNADQATARQIKNALVQEFSGALAPSQKTERMNHASFGITIGYGDLGPGTLGEKLNGIQLLGKGKTIQIDGRPVMETYSFIARDNL